MEIKLLYTLLSFAALSLFISMMALLFTNRYQNTILDTQLAGAPLATGKLSGLYLPPMVKLQVFVFLFDIFCVLYYIY